MSFRSSVRSFLFLSLLATSAVTAQAESQSWKNIGPIQSGDVSAYVDYQVSFSVPPGDVSGGGVPHGPSSYRYSANPLWINIHREGLSAEDNVFVQLISYEKSCYRGACRDTQALVERNLEFAEPGRFTGEMNDLLLSSQFNDGYAISSRSSNRQELVVWINGRLYQDPRGGNLQLNMPLR
jgi:hypothetical protein